MTEYQSDLSEGEINSDDDISDVDVDGGEEGDIPENHTKMLAFHAAIKAVLERQVEKLHLEVNESKRLVDIGKKVGSSFNVQWEII